MLNFLFPDPVSFMITLMGSSAFVSVVVFCLIGLVLGAFALVRGLPFGRRGQWLWHPDSPGMRIWVVRGFWGRVFGSDDFATLGETLESDRWRR